MKLLRIPALARRNPTRRQLLKALGVSAAAAPLLPALDGWAADARRSACCCCSPPTAWCPRSGGPPAPRPPGPCPPTARSSR